jgi:nucleotide-binding universal stress UspA family protein
MATMLAQALAAPLRLLRVVRTVGSERGRGAAVSTFTPSASAGLLDLEEDDARRYLSTIAASLPADIGVSGDVRRGDPADEIVRAAHESRAGLIVVATHGKTGIESLLLGSVIPQVLPRLDTPMLLIRLADPGPTV